MWEPEDLRATPKLCVESMEAPCRMRAYTPNSHFRIILGETGGCLLHPPPGLGLMASPCLPLSRGGQGPGGNAD